MGLKPVNIHVAQKNIHLVHLGKPGHKHSYCRQWQCSHWLNWRKILSLAVLWIFNQTNWTTVNTFVPFDPLRKDLQLKAASIFCELAKRGWLPTKSICLYCLFLSLQLMIFPTLTFLISFTGFLKIKGTTYCRYSVPYSLAACQQNGKKLYKPPNFSLSWWFY